MRIASLSLIFAALVTTPSVAADMPAKAAAVNSYAAVTDTGWQGFYIGGHLGYGASGIKTFDEEILGRFDPKGFIGGGQLGYNWQYKNLVAGVEIDATWLAGKDGL